MLFRSGINKHVAKGNHIAEGNHAVCLQAVGGARSGVGGARCGRGQALETHTLILEWVEEVPCHVPVIARGSGRVAHDSHVVGRILEHQRT